MILLPITIIQYIYSFLDYKSYHKKTFNSVIHDINDIGISLKTYKKDNSIPEDIYSLPNSLANKFLKVNHLYYLRRKYRKAQKLNK